MAKEMLIESITQNPNFFGSWRLLSTIIDTLEELKSLSLPDHWLKNFFLGEVYILQQSPGDALTIYGDMDEGPLPNCPFVLTQMALAQQNLQSKQNSILERHFRHIFAIVDLDVVVELFQTAQSVDPYRIENIDAYSNALFVKGMRIELANLAHHLYDVNRYCPETCCVVGELQEGFTCVKDISGGETYLGNYYSLRGEHEKAVSFFQRALRLDKRHASAWTLMGHEFLEMKNTSGAIVAYRNAIGKL